MKDFKLGHPADKWWFWFLIFVLMMFAILAYNTDSVTIGTALNTAIDNITYLPRGIGEGIAGFLTEVGSGLGDAVNTVADNITKASFIGGVLCPLLNGDTYCSTCACA